MEELIAVHSEAIERFALQYGCTDEQAVSLTEEVFRTSSEGQEDLYKTMIELLGKVRLEALPIDRFSFQEDADFHAKIVQLDEEIRVPFILSRFHKVDSSFIATITSSTAAEVEELIQRAKEILGEAIGELSKERLEKRLEFLEKSYNRLPLKFNINNIGRVESSEVQPKVKEPIKFRRKSWATAAILAVLVTGLIAVTYVNGEGLTLGSDERYIEKVKKNFEKEKRKRLEMLGGNEEIFNAMPFVEEADQRFRRLIRNFEMKSEAGEAIDRSHTAEKYEGIIKTMALPSELATKLFKNPLIDNVEESMVFVKEYVGKLEIVQYSLFEEIMPEVGKFLESTTGDLEEFDTELFLSNAKDFDERARNAMTALEGQGLSSLPIYFIQGTEMNTGTAEFIGRIRNALHPLAGSYLLSYEKEPFIVNEKLVYSIDETIGFIETMEETLLMDKVTGNHTYSLDGMIQFLLEAIIMGQGEEPLRDESGLISDVYQEAWKKLAMLPNDSPTSQVMIRVVGEMEASGWKESQFYSALGNYRIYEAYSFARDGVLEEFELNPDLQLEEMYDERMGEPNSMEAETVELYAAFSDGYDREFLQYVHPLLILSLFYYANEMENPLMMWHLMDEEERTSESDAYVKGWQKRAPLLLENDFFYYRPSLLMGTDEKRLVPIEFTRDKRATFGVWMTYADDNVWQIQRIVNEGKAS